MIRIVETENGKVQGISGTNNRITAFKGIPFAAPPVGKNRWRAPQPVDNWEGIRLCAQFAPISMQSTPGVGDDIYCREWHVDSEIPMGEDCLYLNVWTPAKSKDDQLPVLVWFFGGGFQWGYPAEMEFDGEQIAKRGVVVVTVNYRLNHFGFLAHPELTKENPDAPTNFGSLDQQAGLKWTIRNIKEFGGNPENITIAGQSAGGGSVMLQMTCPHNFGLFQRATVFSAMIRSPYKDAMIGNPLSLEEAEKKGEEFFAFLGISSLEEARALDAFYLRDQYDKFMWEHGMMAPCIDHKFCYGDPQKLFAEGKRANVPVFAGNTSEEFLNKITAASDEEFREKASTLFGEKAETYLSFEEAKGDPDHGYGIVSGIECTVKAAFLLNEKTDKDKNCFYYCFDPDIPGFDNPGTFHSVDLWFFFETLGKCWRPFVGRHYDLARQMCDYWVNFMKNGDPNGMGSDTEELPYWGAYSEENRFEMIFTKDGAKARNNKESDFIKFLVQIAKESME